MGKVSRFWVSWEEPGLDSRPLKVPPPPQIKAWWESGFSNENEYTTICAVIDTDDQESIATGLLNGYWEPRSWRFIQEQGNLNWRPSDRFPWPEEQSNETKKI